MPIAVLPIYRYKKSETDLVVTSVSHSQNAWHKELSPFNLGPVHLYQTYYSQNMENAWQYSKVYKKYTDKWGDPTPQYFTWAWAGWRDKKAVRYPMGRGAVPEYSYWNGDKLNYINARKVIYGPLYLQLVRQTTAWTKLKGLYRLSKKQGKRLVILDFDAYDHRAMGMSLVDVLNNPRKKMGHGFVLAMMLLRSKALDQFHHG